MDFSSVLRSDQPIPAPPPPPPPPHTARASESFTRKIRHSSCQTNRENEEEEEKGTQPKNDKQTSKQEKHGTTRRPSETIFKILFFSFTDKKKLFCVFYFWVLPLIFVLVLLTEWTLVPAANADASHSQNKRKPKAKRSKKKRKCSCFSLFVVFSFSRFRLGSMPNVLDSSFVLFFSIFFFQILQIDSLVSSPAPSPPSAPPSAPPPAHLLVRCNSFLAKEKSRPYPCPTPNHCF